VPSLWMVKGVCIGPKEAHSFICSLGDLERIMEMGM
jgi:hypothetical protein